MNSLEYINREIKITKKSYEAFKLDYKLFGRESDKKESEKLLKKLIHFQQVKCVLEAWEVVKNKLNLKVQTEETVTEGFCMKGYWLLVEQYPYIQTTILEQEEYDILKKALEVDNSVKWVEHTLKDFKVDNLL